MQAILADDGTLRYISRISSLPELAVSMTRSSSVDNVDVALWLLAWDRLTSALLLPDDLNGTPPKRTKCVPQLPYLTDIACLLHVSGIYEWVRCS